MPIAIIQGTNDNFYGVHKKILRGSYGAIFNAVRMKKNQDGSFSSIWDQSLPSIVIKIMKKKAPGGIDSREHEALQTIEAKGLKGFGT